jgi:phosphatidylserine decarboxylase
LLVLGFLLPFFLVGLLTLFTLFFFRDPKRFTQAGPKAVLTPADGRILHIRQHTNPDNPLQSPAIQVSIFMSIFDVHVNRMPMDGIIRQTAYHPGKFFSANLDKASAENERNHIRLQTADSRSIVIIQIAGLIARRIACWVSEGDRVKAGQRFGLIRFGSRLEVYLPMDTRINVKQRQHVKAGVTVIGYLS